MYDVFDICFGMSCIFNTTVSQADLTSLYSQMNSFPSLSHLSHLWPSLPFCPCSTHTCFHLSSLFITSVLKASAMDHSFPSMWSFFLLYSASWCNPLLSSPWNLCFSMMLCLSACFLWHKVSQLPIFLHTDLCSLSFPYPLFTPLSSPWLPLC